MTGPVHYHLGQFPPPPEQLDWPRLVPLIGPANAALARYDGLVAAIPKPRCIASRTPESMTTSVGSCAPPFIARFSDLAKRIAAGL